MSNKQENIQLKSPSFFGGYLLVSGSCIGAAMLAFPLKTGFAGFFPSFFAFLLVWAFMTLSALMLVEVCTFYRKGNSLITMARQSIGPQASIITWGLYLCLFYALMVAYSDQSGRLIQGQIELSLGISLPQMWCGLFCVFVLFLTVLKGTKGVDILNRVMMLALFISYFLLIFQGFFYIDPQLLLKTCDLKAFFFVFPVLITAFGFHNILPSLCEYYQYEKKQLYKVVIVGSLIPLLIYLLWNVVILGIIPFIDAHPAYLSFKDKTPTEALTRVTGVSSAFFFANAFAFFAILTSFVGMGLGLVDFLSDGLKITKKGVKKLFLCSIAFFPPYIFSLFGKNLFLNILELVGGCFAICLFGFLPAFMLRRLPKREGFIGSSYVFYFVLSVSTVIFFIQLFQQFSRGVVL